MNRFLVFSLLIALAVAGWLGFRNGAVRVPDSGEPDQPDSTVSAPAHAAMSESFFAEAKAAHRDGSTTTTPVVEQATWAAASNDEPLSTMLQRAGSGQNSAEQALALYLRTQECEQEAAALETIEGSALEGEMRAQAIVTMAHCDRKPDRPSLEWLAIAADQGNGVARRAYFGAAVEHVTTHELDPAIREAIGLRAASYLRDALASGDAMALREISLLFSDGTFATADAAASAGFMTALARTGVYRPARVQAEQGMAALDPESRARAERLAERVYRNCCG